MPNGSWRANFSCAEEAGLQRFDRVTEMGRGLWPCMVFRGAISRTVRDRVREILDGGAAIGKRPDDVPACQMGPFHFGKTTEEYFAECEVENRRLEEMFGDENPILWAAGMVRKAFEKEGIKVRWARDASGRAAGLCTIRIWRGVGNFSLKPHDDFSQLRASEQRDFEIQAASQYSLMNLNLCIAGPSHGGEVRIWNYLPSDEDKRRLGLYETGYPYPESKLGGYEHLDMRIDDGDIYVVNGAYVHAVTPFLGISERIIMSIMMAKISEDEVVIWT